MSADIGWMGRVKTDGTGTAVTLAKTQQLGLALFEVAAGQRARVVVSGATFLNSYELHVWSPNATVAAHSEAVAVSGSTTFDLAGGTLPGTYVVEVRPASTDTGSVTLSVTAEADATATATVDGAAVTATTTAAGQRAVYQFTGTAGQRVFTTLTTVTATDYASAQLVSPAGQVLATNTLLFTSANSVGYMDTTTLPMNGVYRIEVIPQKVGTGSYKVQIASVPADIAATAAIGGSAVAVTIAKAGQNAKITFPATAGARTFTRVTVSSTSSAGTCFNAALARIFFWGRPAPSAVRFSWGLAASDRRRCSQPTRQRSLRRLWRSACWNGASDLRCKSHDLCRSMTRPERGVRP